MNKVKFYISITSLQILDVVSTKLALANPNNYELNIIPFSILFPVKILIFPLVVTYLLYSSNTFKLYREEKWKNINAWIVIVLYVFIVLNNLILSL